MELTEAVWADAEHRLISAGWEPDGECDLAGTFLTRRGVTISAENGQVWVEFDRGFIQVQVEDLGSADDLLAEIGWRIRCDLAENGEAEADLALDLAAALG